jgi:hypothetical protein
VLDAVQEQFTQLKATVSASDNVTLDRHLEKIRGVERRMSLFGESTGSCTVPVAPPVLSVDDEMNMPLVAQLQIDLLALAMACDFTRVASLQFSNAINAIRFPWLDSLGSGHTLSHAGPSDSSARTQLTERSTWYADQVAYLLAALSRIQEGEGTALDNSVVLWGNEISVGNTHSLTNIPFVLAGGGGGMLRTGRYVTFDGVPHNNLLITLLNIFGIEQTTFGHPDFGTGALPGLTV